MDVRRLKVNELREELQRRGLDTRGLKAELAERLRTALGEADEPQEKAGDAELEAPAPPPPPPPPGLQPSSGPDGHCERARGGGLDTDPGVPGAQGLGVSGPGRSRAAGSAASWSRRIGGLRGAGWVSGLARGFGAIGWGPGVGVLGVITAAIEVRFGVSILWAGALHGGTC